jgi:hypothetical protein
MRSNLRRGLSALAVLALVAGSALVGSSAQASAGGWISTPSDGLTVGTGQLRVTGAVPSVFDHSYWWVDSGAATTISVGSSVDPVPFDFTIAELAPGEHRIFVSSGPGEGVDYVDIVVDPPPSIVITVPLMEPVTEGTQVPFSATITDSNLVSWTIIGGSPLPLSGTDANPSVSFDTTGWPLDTNWVHLTATDAFGSATIAEYVVKIQHPPAAPPTPPQAPPPTWTPPIIPINPNPPPAPPAPPPNPNPPADPTPTPTPSTSTTPSVSEPSTTLVRSQDTEVAVAVAGSEPAAKPTTEPTSDSAAEPTIDVAAGGPDGSAIPAAWVFGGFALILAIALAVLARFLLRRRA